MADGTVRGRFVWHDLQTPNPAGAHDFYGNVLGWKKQAWDQDPSYQMFAAPSGPLGGAVETRNATPQWLAYIGTKDVDEAIAAATALGGRVQTPATPLPNGGTYAVLVDPQGATFGVHASSSGAPPEQAPQIGEFSWHELATNVAPNVAFGFYSSLFGWDEITQYDMGPMGMYLIFGRNGTQLGGMFDKGSEGKPGSAYWLGYVSVDDVEGTIERAKAARGSLLTGPMDVPGGDRIAQLMDPHGAFFALHMRAGTARPATKASPPPKASKPAKAVAPKKKAPAPKKPSSKTRPAKKAAAKKKPTTARKAAKKKAPAKKPTSRKTAKKAKGKAKTRKRGR
ncbi:MAG TPA: VOC family protein [Gammaproteobacteria bacterium]|nr:VOC family protein [Gammaproteobacteria bacterium]